MNLFDGLHFVSVFLQTNCLPRCACLLVDILSPFVTACRHKLLKFPPLQLSDAVVSHLETVGTDRTMFASLFTSLFDASICH